MTDESAATDTARSEIRLVTSLFIDVVGSTDATARLGPERMQRLLSDAFGEMSGIISAHGGVVEKYVGDAIFALFGAPTAHADDPDRALRAADACARWSSAEGSLGGGLGVRIGLETGEVLVNLRGLDSHQRMVVGDSVNLAARLQQYAEPEQIIVGPICHEAATSGSFEPMGSLQLKGLGEVEAWRFLGFRPSGGAEAPEFIGRETELAVLREAYQRAQAGEAVLAVIVGPPGQGKSRLAAEAIRLTQPGTVMTARCRPGTEAGTDTPLRQLIEADVPAATADSVHARLRSMLGDEDGPPVATALCHSVGLAADPALLAISRYEQREFIAGAWGQYLASLANEQTLALLVEDLHWADPVLLRVVDQVSDDLVAPVLVLATARPEFLGSAHLRPSDRRIQIDLGPLDDDDVERLAQAAGVEGFARAAVERGKGNPLFVIELARVRTQTAHLPVTIQAAIAARLDELGPQERDLLQRTSVAGETFDVRDAALLGERDPGEVAAAIGRFAHLGFVTPVGTSYRFHHVLVRDVAYGRLPVGERLALHARFAEAGLAQTEVEALAHHWWEALKPPDGQWVWDDVTRLQSMRARAFRVHIEAGARLEARNAPEEALEIYIRAVELADEASDKAAAEAAIGRAYARQGRGDDAWKYRLRAIDLYRESANIVPAQLYADMLEIATFNWGYFQQLPEDDEVVRLLDEGLQSARDSGDDVSLVRLLAERAAHTGEIAGGDEIGRLLESADAARFADGAQRMATVYAWFGRIADAIALFETVFDRLIPAGAYINEPEALAWYGLAAFLEGDLARADGLADRLQAVAVRRSVHTRSHAYALRALIRFGQGDWDGLQQTTTDLRSLADENPDVPFCLLSGAAMGYAPAADILAGGHLPADIDAQAKRHVDDSERVQAASVMLPKVMAGDFEALASGLRGYEPGLRLWDRYRAWDVMDLIPAIATTMLERWQELPRFLARLDEFGLAGALLGEAAAAAIREEAAANGGLPPKHEQLRELGYLGISELLRFRPAREHDLATA